MAAGKVNTRVSLDPRLIPDIDTALCDLNLLGAALGPVESWATWRVVLKAAFGLLLSAGERQVFTNIAGAREPPLEPVKELWAIVGRRAGKSRMAALVAAYIAAFGQHRLAPGEVGHVIIVAASKSQAKTVFGYVKAFFESSPILRQLVADTTSEELRLKGNIVVSAHSTSFRTIRGRTLLACVFDEVAFWMDETSSSPDIETYRAVLPALATTKGKLVAISTPYRRTGLLFQKHQAAYGRNDPTILVVQAPTVRFNPEIDEDTISREREADPASARSEWEGLFRNDIADFLELAAVDAVIDRGVRERPPDRQWRYVGFVDPSGGGKDSFAIAIGHKEGTTSVLDVLREVRPPFNPEAITAEFAALLRKYRLSTVSGDRYAGEWVASQFRANGITYLHSERNKSELLMDLLPAVNSGAVALLDNERLVQQLTSLERRAARGGRTSIDHPPGGHDDLANVAAGALTMAAARAPGPWLEEPMHNVEMRDPLADF